MPCPSTSQSMASWVGPAACILSATCTTHPPIRLQAGCITVLCCRENIQPCECCSAMCSYWPCCSCRIAEVPFTAPAFLAQQILWCLSWILSVARGCVLLSGFSQGSALASLLLAKCQDQGSNSCIKFAILVSFAAFLSWNSQALAAFSYE